MPTRKAIYVGRVACIDIQKFGDTKRIVYKFEFAPPENTINIIFNQLKSTNVTYSQLKSRGTAICLRKHWDGMYDVETLSLSRIDDLLWSGTIVDGFINGTGAGIVHRPAEGYVYIQGTFSRGIPSGKVIVKNLRKKYVSGVKIAPYSYATNIQESDAMMATDIHKWKLIEGDAKIKDAVLHRLHELYPSDYERMKKAYEKALTITAANYKSFVQDDTADACCNVYKAFKYDPKGIIPKAAEMQDVYQILDGLNFKPRNYFWVGIDAHFYESRLNEDRRTLNDYISLAKKCATNSKYGYKRFHSMAISKLETVLSDINEKGKRDHSTYLAEKAKKERERAHYSGGGGWSSGGSSSSGTSSSGSSSDDSSSSPDIENISIPSYAYTTEWQTEGLRNKVSNKYGENQVREIKFNDGIETKIARVAGENGYWVYNGTGARRYRTLDDAIAAAYVYEKYDKVRQKGRW